MTQKWIAATKNQGKLREMNEILADFDVTLISQEEAGILVDVEEDGTTFQENALKKALEIYRISGVPSLADDSGLEVEALSGAPGIYSARYAGGHGDSEANNKKLLSEMEGKENRAARFVCVIALVFSESDILIARGECHGTILTEPRGENGFGYDPLFYVPEFSKSMAEIGAEQKNKISHRANALGELRRKLAERNG